MPTFRQLEPILQRIQRDERRWICEVIEHIEWTDPTPLAEIEASDGPGIYVMTLYRSRLKCYERLVDRGHVVYAGSSGTSLAIRMQRHATSVADIRNLDVADVGVIAVGLPSGSASLAVERLLQDAYRPLWNQRFLLGFGSRYQGSTRATQATPPFNVLHPGRRSGSGACRLTRHEIVDSAVAHLESTTAQVRRWRLDAVGAPPQRAADTVTG